MTPVSKVCIYARVSTSHHDQNPEIQIKELKRYCGARGWQVTEELIDHGYSGGTDNRPGLKKLLALVRCREVDTVIVLKMDRLFRSLRHLVVTLEEFKALGVTFIAIKDQIDYSTPSGRLMVQVLGSLAEFEKALIVERTIMGLAHARSIGKQLGRPRTTNEKAIVALRTQGHSHRAIQQKLKVSKGAIWRVLQGAPKSPIKSDAKSSTKSKGDGNES